MSLQQPLVTSAGLQFEKQAFEHTSGSAVVGTTVVVPNVGSHAALQST